MERPVITLVFDDNSDTIYTEAFPRLTALGMIGANFIITNNIGGEGLTTQAQLQEMYNAGWDIGNHTKEHIDLTELSEEDATAQVHDARETLDANGWIRSSDLFVPPYDATNATAKAIVAKYARFSTGATDGLNDQPIADMLDVKRKPFSTNTVATIKGFVDTAIANGQYLHLYGHSIADPIGISYPPAMFQEVIEYIANRRDAGLIDVMSISQFVYNTNKSSIIINGNISYN